MNISELESLTKIGEPAIGTYQWRPDEKTPFMLRWYASLRYHSEWKTPRKVVATGCTPLEAIEKLKNFIDKT